MHDDLDPKGTGQSWCLGVDSLIPPVALKLGRLLTAVTSASKQIMWFAGEGLTSLLQKESGWQLGSLLPCASALCPGKVVLQGQEVYQCLVRPWSPLKRVCFCFCSVSRGAVCRCCEEKTRGLPCRAQPVPC